MGSNVCVYARQGPYTDTNTGFKHCSECASYTPRGQVHNTNVTYACTPNKAICTPKVMFVYSK